MGMYRRRPGQPVEAEQFFASVWPWPKGVVLKVGPGEWTPERDMFFVVTIHGQETKIVDGDWILPEPDGKHFYPCKPDIFEQNYEPV